MITLPAVTTRFDPAIPLGMLGNSESIRNLSTTIEEHLLNLGLERDDFKIQQTYANHTVTITVNIMNSSNQEEQGEFTVKLGYKNNVKRSLKLVGKDESREIVCDTSPAEITGTLIHPLNGRNEILEGELDDYDIFQEDLLLAFLTGFVERTRDQFSEWDSSRDTHSLIDRKAGVTQTKLDIGSDRSTSDITVADLTKEYTDWDPDRAKIRSDYLVTDRVMNLIKSIYPKGLKGLNVLVPGCGTGEFEIWLASLGATVDAFDLLPLQVERAKAKLEATEKNELKDLVNFYVGDITDLSFLLEGKKYDLVISLMIHLYLNDEQFANSFKQIASRMKPGANGIYANDFPPRYAMYLNGGRNLYTRDGRTDTIKFLNPHPSLFDTLHVSEEYPKGDGAEVWQTKFIIEPIQYVINCMLRNGLRIQEIILPRPTEQEMTTYQELMTGANIIPPYMIVRYGYQP